MVKVLIYSSKEIYDKTSYHGRAEADIIAYKKDNFWYQVVKNRTSRYIQESTTHRDLCRDIKWIEQNEWERDKENHELVEKYKTHPSIELMKNA